MPVASIARKAIPYAAAALGAGGLGAAVGYGRGKKRGVKRGREQGAIAAARYFRRGATVRNRALQVFAIRNRHLMKQNQALRTRIGQMATERKLAK